MALIPLKIKTLWQRNNAIEPEDLSEIADKVTAWSNQVNSNLKQVGLDLNEDTYVFNNQGVRTVSNGTFGRITALEAGASVGPRNLGIDVATAAGTVTLTSAGGTALSSSNQGKVSLNSTANEGRVIERTLSAPVDIILTGAHWGFGTTGDLTDFPLWLVFIDDSASSTGIFGVMAQAGQASVTTGQVKIVASDVTSFNQVLTATAISQTSNVYYWGYLLSNFDDQGGSSEDLWTPHPGPGDINLTPISTKAYGEILF